VPLAAALLEGTNVAVTHASAIRNGLADYVDAQIGSNGLIKLLTASDEQVALLACSATTFGPAATGVMTASAITSDTSADGGTVTKGVIMTSASATVVRFSVSNTAGAGDLKLNSVAISAGQTVSITSLTYTAPA